MSELNGYFYRGMKVRLTAHSCGLYCPLRREGSSLKGREAARLLKCILVRAVSGGVDTDELLICLNVLSIET